MMSVVTVLFSVTILVSTVTIARSKGISLGDIEQVGTVPVPITRTEITPSGDDLNLEAGIKSRNDSLTENQNELPPGDDIVGENVSVEDGGVGSAAQHGGVGSVKGLFDLGDNRTLEDQQRTSENEEEEEEKSEEEEEDTFIGEELQQDLPAVRIDTGQFLTGIMEKPIRVEADPSSGLGIKVDSPSPSSEEAVECPPPAMLVTPALCGAPACLTHRHCRDPDTACCFNGCVHTCLRPLDAPAVIDWLEDTSLILPMLDEAPGVPRYPMLFEGSSSIAYAQGGGEAVHLQGGCTITSQQYDQLKDYMTKTNIQDCSCTGGEVVCIVKPYKREEE